jgi:hypothetical protein
VKVTKETLHAENIRLREQLEKNSGAIFKLAAQMETVTSLLESMTKTVSELHAGVHTS